MGKISRGAFIKLGMLTGGAAFTIMPSQMVFGNNNSKLRLGFIGTGLRGQELLRLTLQRADTIVPAICDIDERMIASAQKLFENAAKPQPEIYNSNPQATLNC